MSEHDEAAEIWASETLAYICEQAEAQGVSAQAMVLLARKLGDHAGGCLDGE